jgi:hypothetical protein
MAVSSRDRAYMERIGAYESQAHADAQAQHLALPLDARLARSWTLYERHRASLRLRDDDPTPFYARARSLGLYRP